MKFVYPILISDIEKDEKYHVVYIPDFAGYTQGENICECIKMAKEYIINQNEVEKEMPLPTDINKIKVFDEYKIKTFVEIELEDID